MFSFQDSRGPVEVAFTDRRPDEGGDAEGSLDLAEPKPDAPHRESDLAALQQNLDVVGQAIASGGERLPPPAGVAAPTVVRMHQVHGADVHTVDGGWLGSRPEPPVADGLVTALPGVVLLVRVADCVPVVLADVDRRVVGVAHAGRQGLVAGIVPHVLARMRDLGARHLTAWVGPSICGRCYEVPAEMREQVSAAVPAAYAETAWGTPAVDVGAGVRAQLAAEGAAVVDASACTFEHDELFSYRRQGAASGRLGGLVWVRP